MRSDSEARLMASRIGRADCGYQDTAKPRPRTRRVRHVKPTAHNLTHIPGIDIFGNSIPAETVGGDLFAYINFQQRYDIDARIQQAEHISIESPRGL